MVCRPIGKNKALVHSSASALSTVGVVGHGPSSNVSTTSWSVRKSNCLYCRKPKPGPPVASMTTVRLMPSSSGLAQAADFGCAATAAGAGAGVEAGAAAACFDRAAVTSTSSLVVDLAASGSAGRAAIVWGGAASARGEEVQNHTPAITTVANTLASISPNTLRIAINPREFGSTLSLTCD